MIEIVISDKDKKKQAYDAVMSIAREPLMVVTIKEFTLTRSAAQNSLYWAWLTDCQHTTCNDHAGKRQEEWHIFFKNKSLLNIFIRDNVDGTAETMAALFEVKTHCDHQYYENMRRFVIKNISTTSADIKQFNEYLTNIQRFCNHVGICLRTDSEAFKVAMGVKR